MLRSGDAKWFWANYVTAFRPRGADANRKMRNRPSGGYGSTRIGFTMDWSSIIKRLRLERGLKQEALAQLLGVSQSAVSRWENKIGQPNLATARQLLEMTSASFENCIDVLMAEANANFCPMGISTARELRVVHWNALLKQRMLFDPRPGAFVDHLIRSTWFDHYRASGIAAGERKILLSYDETQVGNVTRFAKILTMPSAFGEYVVLRIQPLSRDAYQSAPFAMQVTAIGRSFDA